jgi:hypothetical protein
LSKRYYSQEDLILKGKWSRLKSTVYSNLHQAISYSPGETSFFTASKN